MRSLQGFCALHIRTLDVMNMHIYFELVYLVTALVPSETACFANSPGRISRTAVWISRDEIVERLLYCANRLASAAIRSKTSFTNEFMIDIAFEEIPAKETSLKETYNQVHPELNSS